MCFGPPYVKEGYTHCIGAYYQKWKQQNPYYVIKYFTGGAVTEAAGALWHKGVKAMIRDYTLYMCTPHLR